MRFLTAVVIALLAVSSAVAQPNNKIVSQDDAPLLMRRFETDNSDSRISFEVQYRNIRDTTLKAIQFGFMSLDPFNSVVMLGYATHIDDLESYQQTEDANEVSYQFYEALAENHYTGIIFVNQLRFEDGEVWEADKQQVLDEIGEMQNIPELQLPSDTTAAKPGNLQI